MGRLSLILALAAVVALPVTGHPGGGHHDPGYHGGGHHGCKKVSQRKAWHTYSKKEKKRYIDAELCLMDKEPALGLSAAKNRFEELQALHQLQAGITHGVGAFLPFHRLLMHAHETLLREECGYKGTQPYWDVTHDVEDLSGSAVFDPKTGFGGNGVGDDNCIEDGPFAGYVNNLGPGYRVTEHCIHRRFNETYVQSAKQEYIDSCYEEDTFEAAGLCMERTVHNSGHAGTGGLMNDPVASPGDPVFYLHHTWLDKVFWDWQALDLPARLEDMGISNAFNVFDPTKLTPPPSIPGKPPPIFVLPDAFPAPEDLVPPEGSPPQVPQGDPGNVTTLDHIIDMMGVIPDATIREVMDISGGLLCYEYV